MPVTERDRAHWQAWRHKTKLERQRDRRRTSRRIDYYPLEAAEAIISSSLSRAAAEGFG
jgi:hypothetical protein